MQSSWIRIWLRKWLISECAPTRSPPLTCVEHLNGWRQRCWQTFSGGRRFMTSGVTCLAMPFSCGRSFIAKFPMPTRAWIRCRCVCVCVDACRCACTYIVQTASQPDRQTLNTTMQLSAHVLCCISDRRRSAQHQHPPATVTLVSAANTINHNGILGQTSAK